MDTSLLSGAGRLARLRANFATGPLDHILDFGAAHHEIDKTPLHLIGVGTALGVRR